MRIGDELIRLGEYHPPTGGPPRTLSSLPSRPSVVDEGVEFETVWYGHKDAPLLLPPDDYGRSDHSNVRGSLGPVTPKFSLLG